MLKKTMVVSILLLLILLSYPAESSVGPIYSFWKLTPSHVELLIKTEMEVGKDTTLTLGYKIEGIQHRPEDITSEIDLFYLEFPTAVGEFTLGKFRPSWEYGVFDSVMLTGNAPGMVGARYETSIYGLEYERFFTWLTGNRGKLFGHRMEIPLLPGLKVGVKETAQFSQEFDGFWLCYVPLWPLYLTKYIPGVATTYNNMNVGLDVKVEPYPGIQLYGDLHVTEFPLGPEKRNPPLFAVQAGLYLENFLLEGYSLKGEYLRTTNYLYSHRHEETYYEYRGRPLGTPLGPDAESIGILLGYDLFPDITVFAGYRYESKGEGKVGDYFSDRDEAWENIFLSGVVERRHIPVAGFDFVVSPKFRVKTLLEMELLQNADHKEGESGSRTAGFITMEIGF